MLKYFCWIVLTTVSMAAFGGEPFTIIEGVLPKSPKQPQACFSSDGAVHVIYGIGDEVYYCSVEGENRSVPKIAFTIPNMSLGMRRGPRIAETGKALVATAIGGEQGKGRDGDVLAYRSLDKGMTWLGPVKVNDVNSSAREGLHAMAAADDGTLWCVWLDLRVKGTQLFAARSVDHGASWSKNTLVYRSPDGSVCECCHPSIVAQKNSVHVLFRNSLEGNRDMYLVSSHDQGATFGDAVCLGHSHWQLNACPMDGGMLAINKSDEVTTVWRHDRSVFQAPPKKIRENFLGLGEQPWIASTNDGPYIVWTSKRDGDLMLRRPSSADSEKLGDGASFPVIVATTNPVPMVYAFWEKRNGQTVSLLGRQVR